MLTPQEAKQLVFDSTDPITGVVEESALAELCSAIRNAYWVDKTMTPDAYLAYMSDFPSFSHRQLHTYAKIEAYRMWIEEAKNDAQLFHEVPELTVMLNESIAEFAKQRNIHKTGESTNEQL